MLSTSVWKIPRSKLAQKIGIEIEISSIFVLKLLKVNYTLNINKNKLNSK